MKYIDKKFLLKEYKLNKKSMKLIAKQLNCCTSTIYNYLKKYNIITNDISREINFSLDKTKLAYCAGIIDGEGCIRIGQTKSQSNKYTFDYKADIQIGTTDKSLIDWLMTNIGGHSSKVKNKTTKSKCSWNWWMNPYQSAKLLKKLKKYLVIKKEQANILIKYAITIKQYGQRLSRKEYLYRQSLYKEISKLNKKGQ